ncbi:NAD(P)H oxidoreductase [Nocardia sp. NPDC057668]|uniref:NAD(P)H oxidoreductase n=1 Tax=Nocardia sp. NPDC057668 TaxID=3346202 RepID=UPI00366CDFE8
MSNNDAPNARRTALVVVSHHRPDSLTAHIGNRTVRQLESEGYEVDLLDLNAEGYDPRMTVADQPDWGDRDKVYSADTEAQMRRILAADIVVVAFPVYWMGPPALLKGWIDRVWNYGFAYGRSKPRLAGKRILWLALAGATADDDIVPAMTEALDAQLSAGIAYYCGFSDSRVGLLPDAEERPQRLDAEGNLSIGDAIAGDAKAAHFLEFEAKAAGFVEEFLASDRVPA